MLHSTFVAIRNSTYPFMRRRPLSLPGYVAVLGSIVCGSWSLGQSPDEKPIAPKVTAVEQDVAETTTAEVTAEVRALLEEALRDYRRRDIKSALARLRTANEQYRELSPAEVVLARFYLADRAPNEARQMLQNAAEAVPNDPEAYLMLAEFAVAEGKLVEAESLFDRGRQKGEAMAQDHPRRRGLIASAMAGMASVAEARRNWESAETYLNEWLTLFPNQPQATLRLGRVQFMSDQMDAARGSFDRLRELDPAALPSPIQMGQLYETAGQRELAIAEFKAAAAAYADVPEVRLAIAQWALFAGLLPMARENLDAVSATAGDSVSFRILEGVYWRFLGEYEKAEAIFRAVHTLSPMNFDAINQLALILVDRGDKAMLGQALEYARLNAILQSDIRSDAGRNAMSTLARVLHFGDDDTAARRAIDAVLNSGQIPPHAAYYAAEIYHEAGAIDVALKLVDAAVSSPRSFPEKSAAKQLQVKLQTTR